MPSQNYQQELEWITTKGGGLAIGSSLFDDNWEPHGPAIRAAMQKAGLIKDADGKLVLTPAGRDLV